MSPEFRQDRLYVALLNTGLQSKDPPLYQVIYQLIGALNLIANSVTSGSSSSTTNAIIQNALQQFIASSLDGADGLDGIPGSPGVRGLTGAQGNPGIPGEDGADGYSFANLNPPPFPLQSTRFVLTDAQVKALPTTPFKLVVAPGAGYRIVPFLVDFYVELTGAYTNVNAAAYAYVALGADDWSSYIANDAGVALTDLTALLNTNAKSSLQLLRFTNDVAEAAGWGNVAAVSPAGYENVELNFVVNNAAAGNFTGGNAANKFHITTYYTIQPI